MRDRYIWCVLAAIAPCVIAPAGAAGMPSAPSSIQAGTLVGKTQPNFVPIQTDSTPVASKLLSTERRDKRPTVEEVKDRFQDAAKEAESESKMGNFQIEDQMSEYPHESKRKQKKCLPCKNTRP
jgi:hypothetical protein